MWVAGTAHTLSLTLPGVCAVPAICRIPEGYCPMGLRGHVHVGGLSILIFASMLIVINYTVRGFLAHHANSPAAQGLANVI